jgi:ring-1,2-phenylacetyl-CoA epoxidase subunit PaaD
MGADLRRQLARAGYDPVEVRTTLEPAWSTDWISEGGRQKLADAGIAPPGPAPARADGPVPVPLLRRPPEVACPRCGATATEELSAFGPTACTALRRCPACLEPFEHVRAL